LYPFVNGFNRFSGVPAVGCGTQSRLMTDLPPKCLGIFQFICRIDKCVVVRSKTAIKFAGRSLAQNVDRSLIVILQSADFSAELDGSSPSTINMFSGSMGMVVSPSCLASVARRVQRLIISKTGLFMERLATSPKFIFNQRADNGGRQHMETMRLKMKGFIISPRWFDGLQGIDIFHEAVMHRVPFPATSPFALTFQDATDAAHASVMCKEILLRVLAHATTSTLLLNTGSSGSLVSAGTLKSLGYHEVSQIADRCAPAEEAARVAVS
jgi:hypothetical protein